MDPMSYLEMSGRSTGHWIWLRNFKTGEDNYKDACLFQCSREVEKHWSFSEWLSTKWSVIEPQRPWLAVEIKVKQGCPYCRPDIKKAFLQVGIRKPDRKVLWFLWFDDLTPSPKTKSQGSINRSVLVLESHVIHFYWSINWDSSSEWNHCYAICMLMTGWVVGVTKNQFHSWRQSRGNGP